MTTSNFNHVKLLGVKTVVPQHYIDIDDELAHFDNNPKKLARAKKMAGYGRRYLADDNTTVTDLAVDAAEKLLAEMHYDRDQIELLIFVNQHPDYIEPADACIAHGRLALKKSCSTLDISLGCSGYAHALWTAHAMIASGAVKKCLVLAGDICTRNIDQQHNRKGAPVFGDAASATILEYTSEDCPSYFVTGTDGTGWDKIIRPFGGLRLPLDKETVNLAFQVDDSSQWTSQQGLMKGEDVFKFTMDVAPALIKETMAQAQWEVDDVDFFAIHQANKQIVDNVVEIAGIPSDKAPSETFTKYANNSTNSVVTVICDQLKDKPVKNVVLCTFGIGLSWGGVALNLSGIYNGGIAAYIPAADKKTKAEQIDGWLNYFKDAV